MMTKLEVKKHFLAYESKLLELESRVQKLEAANRDLRQQVEDCRRSNQRMALGFPYLPLQ